MDLGVTHPLGATHPWVSWLQNPYTSKRLGISDIYAVPAFIRRQVSFSNGGSLLTLRFSSLRKCFRRFRASWNVWDSAWRVSIEMGVSSMFWLVALCWRLSQLSETVCLCSSYNKYSELDLVPSGPRVCRLVRVAGVPVKVSGSIIACAHWIPCKGGIMHCVSASTVPCKVLVGGLRVQLVNLQRLWPFLLRT